MAIAQPGKQYYRSLYDVYEDVHLNKRLAGIAKAWGRKDGKALSITPRIRWEPGADKFKPAEMSVVVCRQERCAVPKGADLGLA
jgi:hypothetical protein